MTQPAPLSSENMMNAKVLIKDAIQQIQKENAHKKYRGLEGNKKLGKMSRRRKEGRMKEGI
jgi:hypothetical protein